MGADERCGTASGHRRRERLVIAAATGAVDEVEALPEALRELSGPPV
ncbi:hypothetical protein ACF1AE_03425 [Streptomyces sp. NPDC014986]